MSTHLSSVQVRRGSSDQWQDLNPQLLEGEIGFESNTKRFKIGARALNGQLLRWNELRYAAPSSDVTKPAYPQTGDLWIGQDNLLYFYDGTDWTPASKFENLVIEGDQIINGNTTIEGSITLGDSTCVTGDWIPCADLTYNLGSADKRWHSLYVGDGTIYIGDQSVSVVDDRLQINGSDIAVRTDFDDVTSMNLDLYRPTDADGNITPPPTFYNGMARELPPQENIFTQADYNNWVYDALLALDDSVEGLNEGLGGEIINLGDEDTTIINIGTNNPNGSDVIIGNDSNPCVGKLEIYNETDIFCNTTGNAFITRGGTTEDFVRGDGAISNKLPLDQSDWTNVPLLT